MVNVKHACMVKCKASGICHQKAQCNLACVMRFSVSGQLRLWPEKQGALLKHTHKSVASSHTRKNMSNQNMLKLAWNKERKESPVAGTVKLSLTFWRCWHLWGRQGRFRSHWCDEVTFLCAFKHSRLVTSLPLCIEWRLAAEGTTRAWFWRPLKLDSDSTDPDNSAGSLWLLRVTLPCTPAHRSFLTCLVATLSLALVRSPCAVPYQCRPSFCDACVLCGAVVMSRHSQHYYNTAPRTPHWQYHAVALHSSQPASHSSRVLPVFFKGDTKETQ